ncbi:MAG: translation initiation factor IF-3 [Candidatus Nitrosomaritimum yanchengensis]
MKKKSKWRVNEEIRAHEVRVIDKDNNQIDVMTLKAALELSKKENLDLVEIAPKAKPPVVRIVDFGKFKYREEKKLKEQKKKAKASELKEVRFSPFIADGDYETRMRRVNKFLKDNNKVRAVVVFKGRHMQSKKFGYELLKKVIDDLETDIVIDMEPKFLGRHLAMIVSPVKNQKADTDAKKLIESKKKLKLKQDNEQN